MIMCPKLSGKLHDCFRSISFGMIAQWRPLKNGSFCIGLHFLFVILFCFHLKIINNAHAQTELYSSVNNTITKRYYAANSTTKNDTGLAITGITFNPEKKKRDTVNIHSNRFFWPSVLFALEGEAPKIVIEVKNTLFTDKPDDNMAVNGWCIKQIQARHQATDKTLSIVLDLHAAKDYAITQAFNSVDNIYTIHVDDGEKTGTEVSQITSLLKSWRKAWESKDILNYISHYHTNFKNKDRDLISWKQHKEHLNARYQRILIKFSNLGVKINGDNASAYFKQRYQADTYSDEGYKLIELKKENGAWKIFRENWFTDKPETWPL